VPHVSLVRPSLNSNPFLAEISGTQEQVTVAKSLITIAMELMDDRGGDRDRYLLERHVPFFHGVDRLPQYIH
jgi:hypothetical protein